MSINIELDQKTINDMILNRIHEVAEQVKDYFSDLKPEEVEKYRQKKIKMVNGVTNKRQLDYLDIRMKHDFQKRINDCVKLEIELELLDKPKYSFFKRTNTNPRIQEVEEELNFRKQLAFDTAKKIYILEYF